MLTYDPVGNRLTKGSIDYTYDAADRLTNVEGVSYTFDDNGNMTDRGADDFVWDAEDRLTSATVSSITTTFAYNGDGLRNSLTQGSTTTFTWDVANSIPQVLDDGTLRYVYGLSRIAQVESDDTTHYFLPDGLGSTMKLTESDGDVENSYEYDVFGTVRSSTGSEPNVFKFTGEQADSSTGLEYLRARYYDPETGRFMGSDPFPGVDAIPSSQNRYNYSLHNPVNLTDPSGLCVGFGIPCPKAVKDASDYVVRKGKQFINDPENQYSWIRTGAFGLMGASCGTAWTIIGAVVCVGATSVYLGAVYGNTATIRDKVCAGEYSEDEGYARNILGVTPIPFPVSYPVKEVIKRFIINNTDMGEGLYDCPARPPKE